MPLILRRPIATKSSRDLIDDIFLPKIYYGAEEFDDDALDQVEVLVT